MAGFLRRLVRGGVDAAAVERSMQRVAHDDTPANRRELYSLLLDATLVVPVAGDDVAAVAASSIGEPTPFLTVQAEAGIAVPAFTSEQRLAEWSADRLRTRTLPAREMFSALATMATPPWTLLNPGSETRGSISPFEVEALVRGRLPTGEGEVVEKATPVRIGLPAARPSEAVLGEVRRAAEADSRCVEAWLYLMQQGSTPPELVIGVVSDASSDSAQRVSRDIAQVVWSVLPEARNLLFTEIDADLRASLEAGAGELVFRRP